MKSTASVNIVRLLYLLVCEAAGVLVAMGSQSLGEEWRLPVWGGLVAGAVVAGIFIFVETLIRGFTLRGFSTATFGLLVGLFCAFLLTRVGISEVLAAVLNIVGKSDDAVSGEMLASVVSLGTRSLLYASFGFLGATLALRSSRDDFAFVLPYVRFRQDGLTGQPIVLDADAILDGRVPGVVRAGFLGGRLVVPQFVLDSIHNLIEESGVSRRQRAERALADLEKLRDEKKVEFSIEDIAEPGAEESAQARIVQMASLLGARLMTTDESLGKLARLRGVEVLNLNVLAAALQPEMVVGAKIRLALVRPGKEDHQAVGYLPDGTMIVVNHAIERVGSTCDVRVISTLQTTGGTMIFAELGT